tara:strand:+ start:19581 stop:20375 length:795 start_codon:yes stop_codon:yes gene_type:complete
MNTDKLLGLIFLGFMGAAVVANTTSPEGTVPKEDGIVSIIELSSYEEKTPYAPLSESIADEVTLVSEIPVSTPLAVQAEPEVTILQEPSIAELEQGVAMFALTTDYQWNETSARVKILQGIIGVEDDGVYGHMTREAHIKELEAVGLDSTNVPSVPSYAITPRCTEWWDTARSVGWQESDLLQLGSIMWAETRCQSDAISATEDYGLTQVNWAAHGDRLSSQGISREDLLDPAINLTQAKIISDFADRHYGCRWQPWYMSGSWC